VARRFDKARTAVLAQLASWGVDTESLDADLLSVVAAGNLDALSPLRGSSPA